MSLSRRTFCAVLTVSTIALSGSAKADETTYIQRTITTPTQPMVTRSVVTYPTTTTTTVTNPIGSPVDSTVTRTVKETVISQSPGSAVIELGRAPNFRTRLALLKEQILNGLAKGWITSSQAEILLSQEQKLADVDSNMRLNGYGLADVDSLDRQINVLNIAVSDDLSRGMQTASLNSPQM